MSLDEDYKIEVTPLRQFDQYVEYSIVLWFEGRKMETKIGLDHIPDKEEAFKILIEQSKTIEELIHFEDFYREFQVQFQTEDAARVAYKQFIHTRNDLKRTLGTLLYDFYTKSTEGATIH